MNLKRAARSALGALLVTAIVVIGLFAVHWFHSDRPKLSYRSIDYDVAVQPNGDLKITQHIDVKLDNRGKGRAWKQLTQGYAINEYNLSDITDISVKNTTTGETYARTKPMMPSDVSDAQWESHYAKHWYSFSTDMSGGDYREYHPGKDGIPIYNDKRQYDDWDRGEFGRQGRRIEIGWNIPATKKARSLKFDVTMTLVGATTLYTDVARFQWEPINDDNEVPVGKVTGTVRFPKGVSARNSWAWLHYAGASTTERGPNGELKFTANDVRGGRYLDLVAAWDASVMRDTSKGRSGAQYEPAGDWIRQQDYAGLDGLKRDEADKEAQARAEARKTVTIWAVVLGIGLTAGLLALIMAVVGLVRSQRVIRSSAGEYVRDVPEFSPAVAAKIASALGLAPAGDCENRQMVATLLSLASKRAIAIYPGPARLYGDIADDLVSANAETAQLAARVAAQTAMVPGTSTDGEGDTGGDTGDDSAKVTAWDLRHNSTIVIIRDSGAGRTGLLCASEQALLRLLKTVGKRRGSDLFDVEQMRHTCKRWASGHKVMDKYTEACKREVGELRAVRDSGSAAYTVSALSVVYGAVVCGWQILGGELALALTLGAPSMFLGALAFGMVQGDRVTRHGERYARQLMGLYRYLKDFSDFTDRGAADLVLWDRYLVYATAMGVSEEALRELAKAYPQLKDPDWLDGNAHGSLVYWDFRAGALASDAGAFGSGAHAAHGAGFGGFTDIGAQLNSGFGSIGSTLRAAAPSSGGGGSGGGGGSFSGGGGFAGGGGGSGGGVFGGR